MINCCDEISDPTPIHVASRMAQNHDPIEAGSFVESDRVEKSWADEKLMIRSLFHSDRIVSGIGPWLSENADLSLLQIDGFRCYSQDKRCSAHGGLLTYISEDLQACKINLNIDPTVWEGVFIRIKDLENQKDLVLGNIYRPPHDNNQINTRMWNMISSPATPTVCLEHKPENVQSRNVTLSMPSQSKK